MLNTTFYSCRRSVLNSYVAEGGELVNQGPFRRGPHRLHNQPACHRESIQQQLGENNERGSATSADPCLLLSLTTSTSICGSTSLARCCSSCSYCSISEWRLFRHPTICDPLCRHLMSVLALDQASLLGTFRPGSSPAQRQLVLVQTCSTPSLYDKLTVICNLSPIVIQRPAIVVVAVIKIETAKEARPSSDHMLAFRLLKALKPNGPGDLLITPPKGRGMLKILRTQHGC
jgi:hypothetical protein